MHNASIADVATVGWAWICSMVVGLNCRMHSLIWQEPVISERMFTFFTLLIALAAAFGRLRQSSMMSQSHCLYFGEVHSWFSWMMPLVQCKNHQEVMSHLLLYQGRSHVFSSTSWDHLACTWYASMTIWIICPIGVCKQDVPLKRRFSGCLIQSQVL